VIVSDLAADDNIGDGAAFTAIEPGSAASRNISGTGVRDWSLDRRQSVLFRVERGLSGTGIRDTQ